MAQWNEEQFESSRHSLHSQYQTQLERLIETSAESMIQISSAVSFNNGLMEAILYNQRSVYEAELESLDWNLQTDSGMSLIGLYDLEWKNLFPYGEPNHAESVQRVVSSEHPSWRVDCQSTCRILTYTALLHQGEIRGVLVLSEPLSNVMLRFQRVANIDTGLLGNENEVKDNLIPSWQRSLVALTNPEESKGIIRQASKDYTLKDLSDGIGLIRNKGALYELKAMPIQENQFVVISEVSEDYQLLKQSKGRSIQISAIALVCGEILLLLFLWRPLRKIKLSEQLEGLAVQQAQLLKEKTLALSKAENLSENLCDSISAAVLVLGKAGEVKFANNFFSGLLGIPVSKISGHAIGEFVAGEDIHTRQRVSDVYQGLLDEYEHVGRIKSSSQQIHRMIWRYVPAYYSGEYHEDDQLSSLNSERSIIAIGMPLMLPTLESEQQWLDTHDPHTGLLNRQAAYDLLSLQRKSVKTEHASLDAKAMLFLFRFEGVDLANSRIEQDYLRINSLFASDLKNQSIFTDTNVARMDRNEIALICKIDPGLDPQAMNAILKEMLLGLATRYNVDLGYVASAFIDIASQSDEPHTIFQLLQRRL